MLTYTQEYSIKTSNGMIDLTFTLVGSKEETVNVLVIKDHFIQACGVYTGTIKVRKEGQKEGEKEGKEGLRMVLKLDRCMGVLEDHYALW